MASKTGMKAVILAAGEGQRLRPFTKFKPKVMIAIANKPILQYVIEALEKNGIRDIVIVVGYRKEQIFDFFGSGDKFGVNIDYVVQNQQLGTAHALKQAKAKVGDHFLVVSGDNIVDSDIIGSLLQSDGPCITVREQEDASKYGVVLLQKGLVKEIIEKPERAPTNLVNTGIYRLNRDVFDFAEEEIKLSDALNNMAQKGYEISTCKTKGVWLDVVYPWDILKLNDIALNDISPNIAGNIEEGVFLKGLVSIGKSSVIRSNTYIVGPVAIGDGCEIGPGVCIFPDTSIGNDVCIFPFTEVRNSVIGDGVEIGSNSTIHDSIIDKGCVLKGDFIARSGEAEVKIEGEHHKVVIGAMLGEGCQIDEGVIVRPGVVVGNGSRVRALRVLQESIPDESLVV
jgi:UDP-N-acetylglucosamine diphosphorylase/glucosamine-1-phosphate N-acetyltransferase